MLTKRTALNQIEITDGNHIQLRIAKQVVEGTEILSSDWHRTSLTSETGIDQQIAGLNQNLADQNWPPISEEDILRIQNIASAIWNAA